MSCIKHDTLVKFNKAVWIKAVYTGRVFLDLSTIGKDTMRWVLRVTSVFDHVILTRSHFYLVYVCTWIYIYCMHAVHISIPERVMIHWWSWEITWIIYEFETKYCFLNRNTAWFMVYQLKERINYWNVNLPVFFFVICLKHKTDI